MSYIFVVNLKAIGLKFGSNLVFVWVVPDVMRYGAVIFNVHEYRKNEQQKIIQAFYSFTHKRTNI